MRFLTKLAQMYWNSLSRKMQFAWTDLLVLEMGDKTDTDHPAFEGRDRRNEI